MTQIIKAKQQYEIKHGSKAQPLRAVLFDMDGVLFDSMYAHSICWSEIGHKYKLNITKEDTYLHEGRTGASTINIFAKRYWGRKATPEEIENIYAAKSKLFNEYPDAKPMTGALTLLKQIKADGIQIECVTGSGQLSLLEHLQSSFPGFFSERLIVSSKDCEKGKPHPDPYLLGLKRGGISAQEAIVVENAPLGVKAAKAAGIFTIAVNTGPLPDKVLEEAGADLLYPSMKALSEDWTNIFKAFR